MRYLLLSILSTFFLINAHSQFSFFYSQKQLDTAKEIEFYGTVYIYDEVGNLDPITNLNCLKDKITATNEVLQIAIFKSKLKEIDLTEIRPKFLISLDIEYNDSLKSIKGLNKVQNSSFVRIDSNNALETIQLYFDSVKYQGIIAVDNNPVLKQIDLRFNKNLETDSNDFQYLDRYRNNGHGLYIETNQKLRKVNYNTNGGFGALSRLFVINNSLLDSLVINRLNYRVVKKNPVTDSLSSNTFKSYGIVKDWNEGGAYDKGVRIYLTDNANLSYFGGFEKDSFMVISCIVLNNLQLNNMCFMKSQIQKFPNPQNNIYLLYQFNNNAPGANSIEEVKQKDCTKSSVIETATTTHQIKIYPNPASTFLIIENPEKTPYDVTIFTVWGQKVKEVKVDKNQEKMDVSALSGGLYLIQVQQGEIKYTEKLKIE